MFYELIHPGIFQLLYDPFIFTLVSIRQKREGWESEWAKTNCTRLEFILHSKIQTRKTLLCHQHYRVKIKTEIFPSEKIKSLQHICDVISVRSKSWNILICVAVYQAYILSSTEYCGLPLSAFNIAASISTSSPNRNCLNTFLTLNVVEGWLTLSKTSILDVVHISVS